MKRLLKGAAILVVLLVLIGAVGLWSITRRGLPRLDGELSVEGLAASVTIERDDHGIPRILAGDSRDAARALGFVHGQDRFFQMDLLRRRAAGELAELFGKVASRADTDVRLHRLRARARAAFERASEAERLDLEAYTAGVNAGLAATGAPFEHRLLRQPAIPWRPEDSYLVIYAMYLNLQNENGSLDGERGILRDTLPEPVVRFLLPAGSEWDAPLAGAAFETPPIPGPEHWKARRGKSAPEDAGEPDAVVAGSNNWAVSGDVSADGRAWVANDMHLALGLPHIWYRASLHWTDESGEPRWAAGVSLPGAPGIVAGSTDRIAWGFTNSQGDWTDLVELEFVAGSDTRYLTPDGEASVEVHDEIVTVRDGEPVTVTVVETVWGPIRESGGKRYAVRWIAHDPGSVNFGLAGLPRAETLEQAFEQVHAAGVPCQNFVAASSDGRIGWTIAGPMPARFGHDGRFPVSWADGTRGWHGHLEPERVPRLLDPPDGRLWTANNRTVEGEDLALIGDGGYVLGARAKQIRDGLRALDAPTPEQLMALQLDDRALFLERWKGLLEELVRRRTGEATKTRWGDLKRQLETTWTGHASIDSVAYRMVRRWRHHVSRRVFEPLTGPCRDVNPEFTYRGVGRFEGPLWRILEERPAHLLAPEYESWDELLAAAVEDTLNDYLREPDDTLDRFTWGDRNTVVLAHPLAGSLPSFLARYLNIPAEQLPGDAWMPRVQSPQWGASERFVVSPGSPEAGLLHMPGGQAGHPFSPYYRAGHRAWAEGAPTPFLPGATRHTLVLTP